MSYKDYTKKKKIGILSESLQYQENPLLYSIYYIKKSLNESNLLKIVDLDDLIKFGSSIIIIPDKGNIPDKNHLKLMSL